MAPCLPFILASLCLKSTRYRSFPVFKHPRYRSHAISMITRVHDPEFETVPAISPAKTYIFGAIMYTIRAEVSHTNPTPVTLTGR